MPKSPHVFSKPRSRQSSKRRLFLRLCGSVLGVGIAAPLDAHFVEPYALDVTRHEVFLPQLPVPLDGTTVLHLTDLHRGPITPDAILRRAVEIARELKPDIIALTGDFVNANPADAAPLGSMLADLAPRCGVWACLGNHDYGGAEHSGSAVAEGLVSGSKGRIRVLRNAAEEVCPGIWIAGIEDTMNGRPDTETAVAAVPHDAAVIFLSHNPVGVFGVAKRPYLVLSGHTHGGQICLPGLPTPMPPGMDGFPMAAGWGVFDRARLYISRGVGMGMLPIRFRCRPEIALHVLRRGDAVPRTLPDLSGRALRKTARVARRIFHKIV